MVCFQGPIVVCGGSVRVKLLYSWRSARFSCPARSISFYIARANMTLMDFHNVQRLCSFSVLQTAVEVLLLNPFVCVVMLPDPKLDQCMPGVDRDVRATIEITSMLMRHASLPQARACDPVSCREEAASGSGASRAHAVVVVLARRNTKHNQGCNSLGTYSPTRVELLRHWWTYARQSLLLFTDCCFSRCVEIRARASRGCCCVGTFRLCSGYNNNTCNNHDDGEPLSQGWGDCQR